MLRAAAVFSAAALGSVAAIGDPWTCPRMPVQVWINEIRVTGAPASDAIVELVALHSTGVDWTMVDRECVSMVRTDTI